MNTKNDLVAAIDQVLIGANERQLKVIAAFARQLVKGDKPAEKGVHNAK